MNSVNLQINCLLLITFYYPIFVWGSQKCCFKQFGKSIFFSLMMILLLINRQDIALFLSLQNLWWFLIFLFFIFLTSYFTLILKSPRNSSSIEFLQGILILICNVWMEYLRKILQIQLLLHIHNQLCINNHNSCFSHHVLE